MHTEKKIARNILYGRIANADLNVKNADMIKLNSKQRAIVGQELFLLQNDLLAMLD